MCASKGKGKGAGIAWAYYAKLTCALGVVLAVLDPSTCGEKGSPCTQLYQYVKSDVMVATMAGLTSAVLLMRFRRMLIVLAHYAMELHAESKTYATELRRLMELIAAVTGKVREVQAKSPTSTPTANGS